MLWAVQHRAAGVILLLRRHDTIAQHLPVPLLVITEKVRGEVIAASVPLAQADVDLQFHQDIPLCARMAMRERSQRLAIFSARRGKPAALPDGGACPRDRKGHAAY